MARAELSAHTLCFRNMYVTAHPPTQDPDNLLTLVEANIANRDPREATLIRMCMNALRDFFSTDEYPRHGETQDRRACPFDKKHPIDH